LAELQTNGTHITMKEMPESERPREKLIQSGAATLSNAELIAAILGSGSQKLSALQLAHHILGLDAKGVSHLAGVSIEELCAIKGIGKTKACQLMAMTELGKRIYTDRAQIRIKIGGPGEISDLLMVEMRHLTREVFKVVLLDTKNQVLSIEDVSVGSLNASIVHPREVFHRAIKRSANAMILVHNHPSGHPEPSTEDKRVTESDWHTGFGSYHHW
jgi:DNA repair protein RadC